MNVVTKEKVINLYNSACKIVGHKEAINCVSVWLGIDAETIKNVIDEHVFDMET